VATYRNLGFDEACDILTERHRRLESQTIERSRDLEIELMPPAAKGQRTAFGARVLGQHLQIGPATRSRILREFDMKECANAIPQSVVVQALNHLLSGRLRELGGVKVWHDSDGRLLHLDWNFRQKTQMDSIRMFRTAFGSVSMRNQHTVRRPAVSALADLPTRVEIAVDCQKVREPAPGDPCHGGVMLRHSEMGEVHTSFFATIYRAACWNWVVFGPSESTPVYVGTAQIPLGLNDLAGSLASRLGGLLNRIRRLTHMPCMPMELAVPSIQLRWGLAQVTSDALLDAGGDPLLGGYNGRLYGVLNCFTAVTTHRRGKIPQHDCRILEGLSDSLLIQESPLHQVLQEDLRAASQGG